MAANTNPIYPLTPNNGVMNAILSTAMTNTKAFDGTEAVGTAMALVFTAGANGSRLDQVKGKYTSTNGATVSGTSAATLLRFWLNNGSANTSPTPSFEPDGLPAHTITMNGGQALVAGSIPAAGFVALFEYNLANTRWELLNPKPAAVPSVGATIYLAQTAGGF